MPPIIRLERVYDEPSDDDGPRILVERLWPRGVSKARARIDHWPKDLAPSAALRTWFGHDPDRWSTFVARYHAELDAQPGAVAALADLLDRGPVTFVFASRETRYNNARALKAYLEARR